MDRLNIEQIKKWAEEFCLENALFLVRIENSGNKIVVFADSMDNITIDQCTKLSRYIQSKLEETNDILSEYSLDVSSPGMSNPLIIPEQYKKRIGKNLRLILDDGVELEGKVKEVDNDKIKIEVIIPKNKKTKEEEKIEEFTYNYNQIKKAFIPLPTTFKKK